MALLRAVIVPQKQIGEDTAPLKYCAPKLWQYLMAHQENFVARKSSIYQNQPPFAYFGLGPYSFASYKVAISGLYKTPLFRAVGPVNGRPVMFDDTCYFLACASPYQAALLVSLLHHPLCSAFIHSIVFWDAKRPITKKLLQRIDLLALLRYTDRRTLLNQAREVLTQIAPDNTHSAYTWPDALEDLILTYIKQATPLLQMTLLE